MTYWPGTNILKSENAFTDYLRPIRPSVMWTQIEETRAKKLMKSADGITAADRKKEMLARRPSNLPNQSGAVPNIMGVI